MGKKPGGERIAILTRWCLHCLWREEDFGSGLVDMRVWEAEHWNISARVRGRRLYFWLSECWTWFPRISMIYWIGFRSSVVRRQWKGFENGIREGGREGGKWGWREGGKLLHKDSEWFELGNVIPFLFKKFVEKLRLRKAT